LVKIGWSKSEKNEYEHKAAKHIITALIDVIAKIATRGRIFTMEEVLPLRDKQGVQIPTYQAYLAMAWLRKCGILKQHGRQGYSLKDVENLHDKVGACWDTLQLRKY